MPAKAGGIQGYRRGEPWMDYIDPMMLELQVNGKCQWRATSGFPDQGGNFPDGLI
jgi:hypothetical protein